VTVHTPAAPTARPRLRAEHVVAAVVVALAVLGVSAVVPDSPPRGMPVATTCAWHGSRLATSGSVLNTGLSSGQFRITARVGIAGRAHALRRVAFADLSAFSAGRWSASYTYARKGLVGDAITSCVAHVRTIPPPTGED
jgi:hypothetical protein